MTFINSSYVKTYRILIRLRRKHKIDINDQARHWCMSDTTDCMINNLIYLNKLFHEHINTYEVDAPCW